jgi:hypothetical protein
LYNFGYKGVKPKTKAGASLIIDALIAAETKRREQ